MHCLKSAIFVVVAISLAACATPRTADNITLARVARDAIGVASVDEITISNIQKLPTNNELLGRTHYRYFVDTVHGKKFICDVELAGVGMEGKLIGSDQVNCDNRQYWQEETDHVFRFDYERANIEVNKVYKHLMSTLNPQQQSKLRKEELAWDKWRVSEANRMASSTLVCCGSAYTTDYYDALAKLTRKRTEVLKHYTPQSVKGNDVRIYPKIHEKHNLQIF